MGADTGLMLYIRASKYGTKLTDRFPHFHHQLLKVNVPFEVGMCSSPAVVLVSERNVYVLLSHNTQSGLLEGLSGTKHVNIQWCKVTK